MNYRPLGKTGLMVSEIGFGGEWITPDMAPDQAKAILDHASANGINVLDCWMSDPRVRSLIGDAIQDDRDQWIIQGHIGSTWQPGPIDPATYQGPRDDLEKAAEAPGQYERTRDIEKVRAAFEDMLARFHTDHIELGMIHFVDDPAEFDQIMAGGPYIDYVRELKANGTIGHIGLSTHNPEVARKAAESGEVEMVMFSVNPAFDLLPPSADIEELFKPYDENLEGMDPQRAELYATCEREGVGITVMKPVAGGRLFSAEDSAFGVALTPVQCIRYALTRPAVAAVMGGYRSIAEVDAALAYETATDAEKDYASVLAGAPKHAYYGQCTYCGHCAPCTVGIDIAAVNKYYDLAAMQPEVPPTVKAHYEALGAHGSDCIACGACEPRCPFGVPIIERMEQAAELFGE